MLNVYIADLTGLEESYDEKVDILHQARADKLKVYKMQGDRVRSLGAGLLLERGLEDYLESLSRDSADLPDKDAKAESGNPVIPRDDRGRCILNYTYGPQGKPCLKEYPYIHFSLSHSGNTAVLALSDAEVGIDVQEHRGYNEKIAKRFYHEEELKLLEAVSEPEEKEILFYKIWTCKEAYIKYTGKGMGETLNSFYFNRDTGKIYKENDIKNVHMVSEVPPGYQCSIVSGTNAQKIDKIIKIIL